MRAEPATRSALLVVSQLHLLPECDRVVYLEHGRIARQGAFDDLLAHDAVAAFCRPYPTASSATAEDAGAAEEDAAARTPTRRLPPRTTRPARRRPPPPPPRRATRRRRS